MLLRAAEVLPGQDMDLLCTTPQLACHSLPGCACEEGQIFSLLPQHGPAECLICHVRMLLLKADGKRMKERCGKSMEKVTHSMMSS